MGAVRVQGMKGALGPAVYSVALKTVPELGSLGSIGAFNSSTPEDSHFNSS